MFTFNQSIHPFSLIAYPMYRSNARKHRTEGTQSRLYANIQTVFTEISQNIFPYITFKQNLDGPSSIIIAQLFDNPLAWPNWRLQHWDAYKHNYVKFYIICTWDLIELKYLHSYLITITFQFNMHNTTSFFKCQHLLSMYSEGHYGVLHRSMPTYFKDMSFSLVVTQMKGTVCHWSVYFIVHFLLRRNLKAAVGQRRPSNTEEL